MNPLLHALKIRPGEAHKVLMLSTYLLLTVSAFICGRIARDALFLSAFNKEDLAYMYISVAVTVPVPAYLYARVADRFRRDRLIILSLMTVIIAMTALRLLLEHKVPWVYVVFYNFVEMFGTFLVLQFWTFAGDLFSARDAKRVFPLLGLGGVIASILCGVLVSAAVKHVGTENLLYPQMVCLGLGAMIIARLGRDERSRLREATTSAMPQRRPRHFEVKNQVENVFASKHLKLVAGMTVATFICVPLMDYQFKVLAKDAFSHNGALDTDALSSFMGLFTTMTGMVAAAMQLGLTGRILERLGIVVSLLILPVALLLGLLGMAFGLANPLGVWFGIAGATSAFGWALVAKGAENAFRYSIYDATMQVIYTPVPSAIRGRAKTFIDGILKPGAGGLAGAAMVLLVGPMGLPVTSLAVVAAALTGAWIVMILLIRGEYVAQLLSTLRRRRLDFSEDTLVIEDDATVSLLRRTLHSTSASEVRNALELAKRVQRHDLSDDILALVEHPEADLRVRAIDLLSGNKTNAAAAPAALRKFSDEDPHVRAAAVRAYCAIVGEPALDTVRPMLKEAAPEVRGVLVASLIKHGGVEAVLLAGEELKTMERSPDAHVRLAAARALLEIGERSLHTHLHTLMRDGDVRVQVAAVQAAGAVRATELLPALIYKLGRRECARAAAQALTCFGPAAVELLGKVLSQEREEPMVRRQVPRILERIGTARCLDILMLNLSVNDPDTRRETARAAARLRFQLGAQIDETRVRRLITEEIHGHYQSLAALEDMSDIAAYDGPNLLRDAIEERMQRNLDRIFRLLSIVYPLKTIELVYGNLRSHQANTRANAIEVLDNLLDNEEKRRLLPLIEEQTHAAALKKGTELFSLVRKPKNDWIADYLRGRDPWLVVVALHVVTELGLFALTPFVLPHLKHADAVVRETALRATSVLLSTDAFLAAVNALEPESAPCAKKFREWIVAEAGKAKASDQRNAQSAALRNATAKPWERT